MAPKDLRHRRLEKQVVATNFSVQDRRNNARLYMLNKQRKEQLMPLGMGEVAARLHIYREPVNTVLDVGMIERRQMWRTNLLENAANGGKRSGAKRDRKVSVRLPAVDQSSRGPTTASNATAATSVGPPASSTANTVAPPPIVGSSGTHQNQSLSHIAQRSVTIASPPAPKTAYEEWIEKGCPTGSWKDMLAQEVYLPERLEKVFYKAKYSQYGTYSQERLMAIVRGDYGGGANYDADDLDDEESEEGAARSGGSSSTLGSEDDDDNDQVKLGSASLPRSKTHSLKDSMGASMRSSSKQSRNASPLPSSTVTPRSISVKTDIGAGASTNSRKISPAASRSASQKLK